MGTLQARAKVRPEVADLWLGCTAWMKGHFSPPAISSSATWGRVVQGMGWVQILGEQCGNAVQQQAEAEISATWKGMCSRRKVTVSHVVPCPEFHLGL